MFEIKSGGWGWELWVPASAGYKQFQEQVENQNAAVIKEGRNRQIYYCLPNAAVVDEATRLYGRRNSNSHFLVCD